MDDTELETSEIAATVRALARADVASRLADAQGLITVVRLAAHAVSAHQPTTATPPENAVAGVHGSIVYVHDQAS
jgi:hypothetical protein